MSVARTGRRALQLTAGLLLAAALALNGLWLGRDQLVRDGDEEGHVGAAELFVDDYRNGRWGGAVARALWEDMGDYPSLYPAAAGTWWWLSGEPLPSAPPVRAVNLLFLALAGLGVAIAARDAGPLAAAFGGLCALHLPLGVGVGRHFMPEGALSAAVALSVAAAAWQRRRPGPGRALALGLALGCGLLTKQTFPVYVAIPALLAVRWRWSLLWAIPGALIAAPWYALNLAEQLEYGARSAGYAGDAGALAHLMFYPRALLGLALGPVWAALVAGAALVGWRGGRRRQVLLGLGWLLGGLLLLTAIPKKYDRLLTPLLPGAALVLAAGASARPRLTPLALLGVGWTGWLSFQESRWTLPPEPVIDFEPGCIQTWLRPPEPRGLGYEAIAAAASDAPYGPIRVYDAPAIPCDLQTTFGWQYHLGPWLRRVGQERPVYDGEAPGQEPPALIVDFREGASGAPVDVPLLGVEGRVRRP